MLVDNVKIYGIEESIKRSKYPMSTDINSLTDEVTSTVNILATSKRGSGHDNFLNGIIVQFDLSFTIKAWTEMQRYNFIDFISSQSTMHRITRFNLNDSYIEYVDKDIINIMKKKVKEYNETTDEKEKSKKYLEILYSNPCGMILTAGITTNYRQLKTIYSQRKNHRLPEWQDFCRWIETLPHSEWLTKER